jgi:flagellar basal-body rod protein FlgB
MSLIDQTLGFHADALTLRARRSEVIASNIANSDTPGFKARDIEFAETLRSMTADRHGGLARTAPGHIAGGRDDDGVQMRFRQPSQPSADGNTVEAHVEKAAFLENSAGYEATLRFLEGRISGLMTALRGDQS